VVPSWQAAVSFLVVQQQACTVLLPLELKQHQWKSGKKQLIFTVVNRNALVVSDKVHQNLNTKVICSI
jgi:hypothetical protein